METDHKLHLVAAARRGGQHNDEVLSAPRPGCRARSRVQRELSGGTGAGTAWQHHLNSGCAVCHVTCTVLPRLSTSPTSTYPSSQGPPKPELLLPPPVTASTTRRTSARPPCSSAKPASLPSPRRPGSPGPRKWRVDLAPAPSTAFRSCPSGSGGSLWDS